MENLWIIISAVFLIGMTIIAPAFMVKGGKLAGKGNNNDPVVSEEDDPFAALKTKGAVATLSIIAAGVFLFWLISQQNPEKPDDATVAATPQRPPPPLRHALRWQIIQGSPKGDLWEKLCMPVTFVRNEEHYIRMEGVVRDGRGQRIHMVFVWDKAANEEFGVWNQTIYDYSGHWYFERGQTVGLIRSVNDKEWTRILTVTPTRGIPCK